jgi:hypothetical protein
MNTKIYHDIEWIKKLGYFYQDEKREKILSKKKCENFHEKHFL